MKPKMQKYRNNLKRNLKIIQKRFGTKFLSKTLGISRQTWYNRMNSPEKFTFGELQIICDFADVDIENLIGDSYDT